MSILYQINKPISVEHIRVYISRSIITEIIELRDRHFNEIVGTHFTGI